MSGCSVAPPRSRIRSWSAFRRDGCVLTVSPGMERNTRAISGLMGPSTFTAESIFTVLVNIAYMVHMAQKVSLVIYRASIFYQRDKYSLHGEALPPPIIGKARSVSF